MRLVLEGVWEKYRISIPFCLLCSIVSMFCFHGNTQLMTAHKDCTWIPISLWTNYLRHKFEVLLNLTVSIELALSLLIRIAESDLSRELIFFCLNDLFLLLHNHPQTPSRSSSALLEVGIKLEPLCL